MQCDPVDEQVGGRDGGHREDDAEESGEAQASRGVPRPRAPTVEARRLHDLTHCPYRSWCSHCVRGQAAEYPHRTVVGEAAESDVPRVIMDYCYFKEGVRQTVNEHTESEVAATSLTALVLKETLCDSVWAYALRSKSVAEDPWIADQIVDDLNTVGMAKDRIIVKSDQEPSIVDLQTEIAKRRSDMGTSLENSKVGDSNSNGKVERAIRDVGNMVRTLKSALSHDIGAPVTLDMAVVPWMVRHASYIITRCRVRGCGLTSLQMMKGRKSLTELVPFGEAIMFKIPKTAQKVGSFEERWESGIWLGATIRDGMTLVGTPGGVYKVSAIKRKPDGEQWSRDMIKAIVGSPQQPQPGVNTRRVTTFAMKKLDPDAPEVHARFEPPSEPVPVPRNIYVMKADVIKYGATPGCPGCRAISGEKSWKATHSAACRSRIEELMQGDEYGRRRLGLVNAKVVAMAPESVEEENDDNKKRRLEKMEVAEEVKPAVEQEDMEVQRASKRKAEEEPDDPRNDDSQGAEVVHDNEVTGGASSSASGMAIAHNGDSPTISYRSDQDVNGDDDMIGNLSTSECAHCQKKFSSRNLMFAHLYQKHDEDGEGIEKFLKIKEAKRITTSLQTTEGLK